MRFGECNACALLLIGIVLTPAAASAQTIRVKLDERAQRLLGPQISVVEDRIEAEFEKQMQALTTASEVTDFLDLAANAQALVHKGIGTDYASAIDGVILGVGVGAAIDPGDQSLSVATSGEEGAVPVGAGAQITIMAGYNFARFGVPELTLFAHGMGAPFSLSEYSGSFYNFGVTGQYRLIAPRGEAWPLRWGGLSVTSGVEVSRMRLTLVSTDMVHFDTRVGGVRVKGDSDGKLDLVQSAVSIPLELTTSVTMLQVLTLYAGLGGDLNFGSANLILDLDTTVTANGGEAGTGSAEATLEDAGDPDLLTFRLLGGLQLDFGPVHLFGQVNLLPKNLTLAASAGARVTF
jgi:hypothetical protein